MPELHYTFDHVSIIVKDTTKAVEFYHDLLGIEINTSRPILNFPGVWLQVGKQQIHLLEVPNPDSTKDRPAHGGLDHHFALKVSDFSALKLKLKNAGITYTLSKSGRNALFCRDYDGNAVEIIDANI